MASGRGATSTHPDLPEEKYDKGGSMNKTALNKEPTESLPEKLISRVHPGSW